jgi:hypothetical protein
MTIERDRNGFSIITVTIIDLEGNRLTPAEITEIQEQLTTSIAGPVIVQATLIPGTVVDYAGLISGARKRLCWI